MFDGLDFGALDDDGDGEATIVPGSVAHNFFILTIQSHVHTVFLMVGRILAAAVEERGRGCAAAEGRSTGYVAANVRSGVFEYCAIENRRKCGSRSCRSSPMVDNL